MMNKGTMTMMKKKKKASGAGLLRYEELPEYMKDNEFIRKYYRSEWPLSHAFLSLFSWHNETLNVWTHLLGFLLFLGLTAMHFKEIPQAAALLNLFRWPFLPTEVENVSLYQGNIFRMQLTKDLPAGIGSAAATAASAPRWPFLVFLGGSMLCLLTSSLCHLLSCHSRSINLLLIRLDYAGIAVMIAASFFPPIHYAFLCTPRWRLLYLWSISVFSVMVVLTLAAPKAATGSCRTFRAALFSAMGLAGLVPAVHIAASNWAEARRAETLACEAAMAVLYLVGTGFYVCRVPERWWPGTFDLAGHSHQIFHVFVVAGAVAHYAATSLFLEWRDEVGCVVV